MFSGVPFFLFGVCVCVLYMRVWYDLTPSFVFAFGVAICLYRHYPVVLVIFMHSSFLLSCFSFCVLLLYVLVLVVVVTGVGM